MARCAVTLSVRALLCGRSFCFLPSYRVERYLPSPFLSGSPVRVTPLITHVSRKPPRIVPATLRNTNILVLATGKPWLNRSFHSPKIFDTFLPTTSASSQPSHSPTLPSDSALSIKLFSISYTTTRFNPFFLRFAELAPRFWDLWFAAGVCFGLMAMVAGLAVLTFAAYRIGIWILRAVVFASGTRAMAEGSTGRRNLLAKRAFESEDAGGMEGGGEQVFVPLALNSMHPTDSRHHATAFTHRLLPISSPFFWCLPRSWSRDCRRSVNFKNRNHLVLSNQSFLTLPFTFPPCPSPPPQKREGVPINNAGVFLYILYPGAFVDLPERALSLLPPVRRLRVICAGVWHNAVLYIVLYIALSAGLRIGFQMGGWKLLQGEGGVAVVEVSEGSALYDHLPVSSVIYRLDDTYLDRNINDWNDFLLDANGIHEQALGFCVSIKEFSDAANNLSCCRMDADNPFGQSNGISFSCFKRFSQQQQTPVHDPQNLACLPTTRILASTPPHERCESNFDCGGAGAGVCMTPYAPYKTGQLLRIYAKRPPWNRGSSGEGEWEEDKSILFAGELVNVWENSRDKRLMIAGFLGVHDQSGYTSSFTLALSLLNILPAIRLDGEYALTAVLSILFDETTSTSSRNTYIRRRIEHGVVWYASILVGFVVLGSIITGVAQTASGGGGR
ncbi:hypothetical protein BC937DRAFT_87833 [Endogone sp. FLAS-F59071]|nr:hypothetical protein BC937DRAFT_87833 [Endogone sp. FLAS-F59071]|eukprot:RUS19212.1 hypothetical protein BC937DRAFT_87833 [Endogone sp. FLAS-F59071]